MAGTVDLVAQMIEARIRELGLEPAGSDARRCSFSQKLAMLNRGTDAQLSVLVQRFRRLKNSKSVAAGQRQGIADLLDLAQSIASSLGDEDRVARVRTTSEARLINSVSIDTVHGYRSFNLMHGDVTVLRSDLLVISTHANPDAPPAGQLIRTLQSRWGLSIDPTLTLLRFGERTWTLFQSGIANAPFRNVLTLRIPKSSESENPVAFFDAAIRGTYASIAALEHLGMSFPTVSMPVLYGQRIVDYSAGIGTLLREAVTWLKKSEHTGAIQFVVHLDDELGEWDAAMNQCLGRTYVSSGHDAVIDSLRREIAHLGRAHADGPLHGALRPLLDSLGAGESICIESVCVFGRKLVELMVSRLLAAHRLKESAILLNNIEELRKCAALAPWILSYMHSLRIFGNETVHSRDGGADYRPPCLGTGDLVCALSAARALLAFWDDEVRASPSLP